MPKWDYMRPVLRTCVPNLHPRTQVETILAYNKRNADPTEISSSVNVEQFRSLLKIKFIECYIDKKNLALFYSYSSEKINVSNLSIEMWMAGQKKTISMSEIPETYLTYDNETYDYMIKNKPKPNLSTQAPNNYESLQTIAYHSKSFNALMCPIFKDLKERILAVLNPKIMIFTDMSPEEFSEQMNKNFSEDLLNYGSMDNYISKYDKSQGANALDWDLEVMVMFGVPDGIICLWRVSHERTFLLDRINGFKATVVYQRKSRDAMTLLGNTLFLMAVTAELYRIENCEAALFLW